MNNLKTVLGQLKSDKQKDRQQGLVSIREVFERNSVVNNLDDKGDGRAWLVVFQALFMAVVSERAAVVKKGLSNATPLMIRRLEDASSTVRWLVERSVIKWGFKVAKALASHLMQMIVHNGRLFQPVCLNYVKALRTVLSYRPHLDRFLNDDAQWIKILSLSFAVVLGDNLNSSLDDEDDGTSEAEVSSQLSDDSADLPNRKRKRKGDDRASREGKPGNSSHSQSVSPEQIEFVAVIALVLRSCRVRLIDPNYPTLAHALLQRFYRFFCLFPTETSAHLDVVSAINSALDGLALNARDVVMRFGSRVWDHLLTFWNTKNRQLKEEILLSLTLLIRYVSHVDAQFDRADGVGRLLKLLNSEHETRWPFDPLSIDFLRFEVANGTEAQAFVANTYRYGLKFSSAQAIAWAVLELQADCTNELYSLSEAIHTITPGSSRLDNKRTKIENPLVTLLQNIQTQFSSNSRIRSLQCLLFVIDRHWTRIHAEMQEEVVKVLLQCVSTEDAAVQSWVFCCFAAVAEADCVSPNPNITWNGMWTHSMRRTNSPLVGRVACHAAHALLLFEKLPTQKILSEIETMIQDINVQGPSAPYDSVCTFLTICLKVASQDARLYRLHLDDKVLAWLTENWGAVDGFKVAGQSAVEQYTLKDVLSLLESVCGFSQRSNLICPIPLPHHPVVNLLQSNISTLVIREFLLSAKFPEKRVRAGRSGLSVDGDKAKGDSASGTLIQPASRERKVSLFLQKLMDQILAYFDSRGEGSPRPPADNIRRLLDFTLLTISFESTLVVNGIRSNRRSLIAACKIIVALSPFLVEGGWTLDETISLYSTFLPLTTTQDQVCQEERWEPFVDATRSTGIKRDSIVHDHLPYEQYTSKVSILPIIWQSSDVQDALCLILENLKQSLAGLSSAKSQGRGRRLVQDISLMDDERDGFASMRMNYESVNTVDTSETQEDGRFSELARICLNVLAIAPKLRLNLNEPTRDKSLLDTICECEDDTFITVLGVYLRNVQNEDIHMNLSSLDRILDRMEQVMLSYRFGRDDRIYIVVVQLVASTARVWLANTVDSPGVAEKIRTLTFWMADNYKQGQMKDWRSRDALTTFYDRYLREDPDQTFFLGSIEEDQASMLPDALLPKISQDEDIRVRIHAVQTCARLFSTSYIEKRDALQVYSTVREQLCIDLSNYEHMLTRLLCLGNIIITSSAVRRGPYWHLLETCLHSPVYIRHIESILRSAADRMGLHEFTELFEAYAVQLAYSIRLSGMDFTRLPPHLVGYSDRKGFAKATFTFFSPANLLVGSVEDIETEEGIKCFKRHCLLIEKTVYEGMRLCFPEFAGYQISFWFEDYHVDLEQSRLDGRQSPPHPSKANLSQRLVQKLQEFDLSSESEIQGLLEANIDRIAVTVLRTVGDMDYSLDGPIFNAFVESQVPERAIRALRTLFAFRKRVNFDIHPPNTPAFKTRIVLDALGWLGSSVESLRSPTVTYHILQLLFAEVARCPLINEQIRLLTCVAIWISVNYQHFKEPTLLRVIMTYSVILLSQPDLSFFAQGLLGWVFVHAKEIGSVVTNFSESIIRISTVTWDFLQAKDEKTREIGSTIRTWLVHEIDAMANFNHLRRSIKLALTAWPGELPDTLSDLRDELTTVEISTILDDRYPSSDKFKVVKRLLQLVKGSPYESIQFSRHDFWRLKDSIPAGQLDDHEIDAFVQLLLLNAGKIRSYSLDQRHGRSIGTRHQKMLASRDAKLRRTLYIPPKRPIVMALLEMLKSDTPTSIRVAYFTLRRIAGLEALDSSDYGSWQSEYKADVTALNFCPLSEDKPSTEELQKLDNPHFLEMGEVYHQWISEVTVFFCSVMANRDPFYNKLKPVVLADVSFASQLLPVLVHAILRESKISSQEGMNSVIISRYFSALLHEARTEVECRRSVVNLVLHLRNCTPEQEDALAYNRWLDIDFMLLSRNAIICGAYTTALMFLELAVDIPSSDLSSGLEEEKILFDIYSHIEEPDGFYGIKTNELGNFLLKRFVHERQWEKAFHFHGATLEASESVANSDLILESLHSFGFNKLAMTTFEASGPNVLPSSRTTDLTFRLGWRTENWDLPEVSSLQSSGSSLYAALRAVHRERNGQTIDGIIRKSTLAEMHRLRTFGNENIAEIRNVTQTLMCLSQVKMWRSIMIQRDLDSKSINFDDDHWSSFLSLPTDLDFTDLENIVATRVSLSRAARQHESRVQLGSLVSELTQGLLSLEKRCLLQLSEAARLENQSQIALNSIIKAQKLGVQNDSLVMQEYANVLWAQKEHKFAVEFLKNEVKDDALRIREAASNDEKIHMALILARLGEWSAEACLEKPDFIHKNYFTPAVSLVTDGEKNGMSSAAQSRATIFYKCAIFAEQQYQAIHRSPDVVRLRVYSERKKQELRERDESIRRMNSTTSTKLFELTQQYRRAKTLYDQDTAQFIEVTKARDTYLQQAIKLLAACLVASDEYDEDATIRLCSLWFANFTSEVLNPVLGNSLSEVASRKYVFLAHQLSARISNSESAKGSVSQEVLQSLLLRMCSEHPFHSLYQVFSLCSIKSPTGRSRRSSSHEFSSSSQMDRASVAEDIFNRLRDHPLSGTAVKNIESLCDAYLEWAVYPIKNDQKLKDFIKKKEAIPVPAQLKLRSIKNLRVPVTSAYTPLDPTMRYQDCVWIVGYADKYETAGGVNLPKINQCHGSDGQTYKQLFKGECDDDLRQDAVMEQVFELCNQVLRRDRETRRRELNIRSYKVIPLAPQAGLIEFVQNTMPINSWLIPAHSRYHPKDLSSNRCNFLMKSTRSNTNGDKAALIETFKEIRKNFHPVMRHFFTERNRMPLAWFESRLKYSRSVATTSIVGHVLGLGDRHIGNILIDTQSGEVVHIDLGIAFEQGKLLTVPERVPFRLTADMIDGFGMSGTEGVFRRCAEETLRVLREGSNVIKTVLEVFKYDPLHSWTASAVKIRKAQAESNALLIPDSDGLGIGISMESGSEAEAADRALSGVARKLDKSLSVEYTVNELISEATDIELLATMFHGWNPFC